MFLFLLATSTASADSTSAYEIVKQAAEALTCQGMAAEIRDAKRRDRRELRTSFRELIIRTDRRFSPEEVRCANVTILYRDLGKELARVIFLRGDPVQLPKEPGRVALEAFAADHPTLTCEDLTDWIDGHAEVEERIITAMRASSVLLLVENLQGDDDCVRRLPRLTRKRWEGVVDFEEMMRSK